jgi:ABC-type nitrate/sulfonate/bicarbonate transport system substrate-binding protein
VLGAAAGALIAAAVLVACSSSPAEPLPDESTAAPADFGDLSVQLNWIKNIEFGGEYFAAEEGYYEDAGFSSVDLLAGGPQVNPVDVVISGQAQFGIASATAAASAIAQGAPIKIIGATFQRNPYGILTLEEQTPITSLDDMLGKTLGVASGTSELTFRGFLTANDLTTEDVNMVNTQSDLASLEAGQIDGMFAFLTNQPIAAAADGYTPVLLEFDDFNLPFVAQVLIATDDTISQEPEMVKAFLQAESRGWTDAVNDPEGSATLAAEVYGVDQDLDVAEQTQESIAQNHLIVTDDVEENGLFTITDDLKEATVVSLGLMGFPIEVDQLFATDLLDEVFAQDPDLIVSFDLAE